MVSRSCTLGELVSTFGAAGDDLRSGIDGVQVAGQNFLPAIATELKGLIEEKMVTPFLAIVDKDKMDCSFLVTAWANFLEGACYNMGGAIASYANIFTLCAQCGFFLVFLIFGVWRHFIDMYELGQQDVVTVVQDK